MTKCCEHNPCPERPRYFLGRFRVRPWRCPQCGQFWVTEYIASYGGGCWSWAAIDKGELR